MTCCKRFELVLGYVTSKDGRSLLVMDSSSISTTLGLRLANQAIDLDKLSIILKKFTPKERTKFMHGHVLNVKPPLELEILVSSALFKVPLCIAFDLVVMVLGLDDDSKINEAYLVLLMLLFPFDDKSHVMFHFS